MQTVTKITTQFGDIIYRNERNQLHNNEGPAINWSSGYMDYYINNRHIKSLKEFQQLTKMSSEDMTAMILKYGHGGFTEE